MLFKKVSIIIPAFNEAATIEAIIAKVRQVSLPENLEKEIIVVDDGSTDHTSLIVKKLIKNDLIYLNQTNQGKASAIAKGFKMATGDILLIQDADLEYDPSQYQQLLNPILSGKTQVVYGSRFLGQIKDMAFINRAANLISNWTMRLLWQAHITDINTCYKVFTKEALSGITITAKHFALETELTIKMLSKGLLIIEIPIEYQARSRLAGKKIRWSTALQMYWPIIKYKFSKLQ